MIVGGSFLNNQKLARALAEDARDRIVDLERYGHVFYRKEDGSLSIHKTGGSTYPRAVDGGIHANVQRRLGEEALRRGAQVHDEMMVTKLLVDGRGAVIGTTAIDIKTGDFLLLRAKSVILAIGPTGRLWKLTSNSRSSTGDGFAMARWIGTKMIDMEMIQFIPLAYVYPEFVKGCTLGEAGGFGPGVKFVNKQGERHVLKHDPRGEFATRDIVARANYIEIKEGRGSERGGIWIDATEVDRSQAYYRPERVPERIKMLRDSYGKEAAEFKKPFEATPAMVYIMGGIEIDEHCYTSTEGLFACGEQSSNIHGGNRLGANALIEIQVFGKRAGESAAARAKELPTPRIGLEDAQVRTEKERVLGLLKRKDGIRPYQLKKALQEIMWDKVGILRNGTGLQEAIEEIGRLKEEELPKVAPYSNTLRYNYDWVEAIEVGNMLEVAEMIACSALLREESRGAHYREDFPKRDDANWLVETVVQDVDGKLRLGTQPVNLTEMRPEGGQIG